jgi:predicted esterase
LTSLTLSVSGPHAGQPVLTTGAALQHAHDAVILMHGRGARAADILSLSDNLNLPNLAFLAPEAAGDVWYPHPYHTSLAQNEPGLSSALSAVDYLVNLAEEAGIPPERVVLAGFSQGACLCAEYALRHARRFGGVAVLAGGVIGPRETPRNYPGSLADTPVFLGCSDPDPYFPSDWITYSADIFVRMGARVQSRLYPNLGHRINLDMLRALREMVEAL